MHADRCIVYCVLPRALSIAMLTDRCIVVAGIANSTEYCHAHGRRAAVSYIAKTTEYCHARRKVYCGLSMSECMLMCHLPCVQKTLATEAYDCINHT